MKAAIRKGLLGYTLSLSNDVPKPTLPRNNKNNSDKVLLKVRAATINPVDYKLPRFVGGSVVGFDVCGVVEEIGGGDGSSSSSSSSLRVGDVVYGKASSGSLAEHAVADVGELARVAVPTDDDDDDERWRPEELAATGVAYQSALQCLRRGGVFVETDDDGPSLGVGVDSVLVIGASGGCGVAGLQLCRAIGVGRVVGVCSGRSADHARSAGATELVDYTDHEALDSFFRDNAGAFDCVYDAATGSGAGENYWNDRTMSLLKTTTTTGGRTTTTGVYTTLNGPASKWTRALAGRERPNEHLIMCRSNTKDLELIVKLLNKIGVRPLTTTMPFTQEGLREAFEKLKSRRTRGKLAFLIS